MRELTTMECCSINGGSYEPWQVVALSGISSGVAYGVIELYTTLSLLEGLKFFAICSVPTGIACFLIVGSIALVEISKELGATPAMHC